MSLEQGVCGRHDDRRLKLGRLIRRRPEAGLKMKLDLEADGDTMAQVSWWRK